MITLFNQFVVLYSSVTISSQVWEVILQSLDLVTLDVQSQHPWLQASGKTQNGKPKFYPKLVTPRVNMHYSGFQCKLQVNRVKLYFAMVIANLEHDLWYGIEKWFATWFYAIYYALYIKPSTSTEDHCSWSSFWQWGQKFKGGSSTWDVEDNKFWRGIFFKPRNVFPALKSLCFMILTSLLLTRYSFM